jgi:dolichol-phosphate mannosyltransferase
MKELIIIPAYNEGKTLGEVLFQIRLLGSWPILLVDDGSQEDYRPLIRDLHDIEILHHPQNYGYGQALISGFQYAREEGCRYVLTIDADGQHDPQYIPQFFKDAPHGDIVSGSRYHPLSLRVNNPPSDRRYVNALITERLNALTGYTLTDAFCGLKAYRVEALKEMRLTEPGYAFPLQLWMQAAFLGLRVKELPVSLIYRAPEKFFPGELADTQKRLKYYGETIDKELLETSLEITIK